MNTYISTQQLRRGFPASRNSNLSSRSLARRSLGPISNALFLGVILTLMGLMYLTQVTKANDYSFTISSLESRKTELAQENQALSIEAARLSSIDKVRSSEVAKGLSEPRSVDFVQ